jgi:hypothetical protein
MQIPKIIQAATAIAPVGGVATLKAKSDALPPSTPAHECNGKKQKIKAAAEGKDFTKAGLFCCKEGMPILELFPSNLEKKHCSFFCFHDKKCSKPNQACNFDHIKKWTRFPPTISSKFSSTAMQLRGKRFGLMPTHSQSTRFPTSMLTSWET